MREICNPSVRLKADEKRETRPRPTQKIEEICGFSQVAHQCLPLIAIQNFHLLSGNASGKKQEIEMTSLLLNMLMAIPGNHPVCLVPLEASIHWALLNSGDPAWNRTRSTIPQG